MNTDISSLLKKGLSGKEAGKLIIGDDMRKAKGLKPLLSKKEAKTIIDSFVDREQLAIYNSYIDLRNSAIRCFTLFNMMTETVLKKLWIFKTVFLGNRIAKELLERKDEDGFIRNLPIIMSEEDYKEKLAKQKEEKLEYEIDLGFLILTMAKFYLEEFIDAKDTPYNDLFKTYETQELTDPEVLAEYNKDEEERLKSLKKEFSYSDYFSSELAYCVWNGLDIDGEENTKKELKEKCKKTYEKAFCPRVYDKTDLLFDCMSFYCNEDNEVNITKFKSDYPEIFTAILKEIKTLQKNLSIKEDLDSLPLDKYSEVIISFRDLYNAGIEVFKREIDYIDKIDGRDVTVIKSYSKRVPDPASDLDFMLTDLLAESRAYKDLMKLNEKGGYDTIQAIETEIKQALASYTLAKLCNEQAEIELAPSDMLEEKLRELRTTIFDFNNKMLFYYETLEQAEKNGYRPIYPEKVIPSKEKLNKVKRKIKDAVNLKEQGILALVDELI